MLKLDGSEMLLLKYVMLVLSLMRLSGFPLSGAAAHYSETTTRPLPGEYIGRYR